MADTKNSITKLKVMTYNVQWFSNFNSQLEMQKKIIAKYRPHVIGLQELSTNGKINKVGKASLADYPHQYLSKHKNYMGFASVNPLMNVSSHEFSSQDPEDMARYGETRAYMTAKVEIDGKVITFINTHLCYLTQDIKFKQMSQLFRRAQKSEYVVIFGDFNCFMKEPGDTEYNRMYKQFVDAGYHLADCSPDTGITKTWTDKTAPKSLSQFTYATDNIITSGNIEIKKVTFDKTKLSWPNGSSLDHIPIVATLYIR